LAIKSKFDKAMDSKACLQNLTKSFTKTVVLAPDGSTPFPLGIRGVWQSPEACQCANPMPSPYPFSQTTWQTPMHRDWRTDISEVLTFWF